MRSRSAGLLFGERATIHDVIHAQREGMKKAVAEVSSTALRSELTRALAGGIIGRLRLDAPVLDRVHTVQLPVEEVDLDVSRDPMRLIHDRRQPFYVKATQLAISVPFVGDAALFRYGTSGYNSPHPGDVVGNALVLRSVSTDPDGAVIRKEFDQRLEGIESTLRMVASHCSAWNEELERVVPHLIEERAAKVKKDHSLTLGFPEAPPHRSVEAADPARPKARAVPDTYDLFLSHAAEDKATIARPLYEALRDAGVSLWFDEAVLTLGDSLRQRIDDGLRRCRFGVVILSPNFFEKQWPQRELDGLVARETATGEKAILPVWHDLNREDVLSYSPTLADRLAAHSSEGIASLVVKILAALGRH